MNNIKPWKLWYRVALSGDSLPNRSKNPGPTVTRAVGRSGQGGAMVETHRRGHARSRQPRHRTWSYGLPSAQSMPRSSMRGQNYQKVTSRHGVRQRGADGFSVEYQYWCTLTVPPDLGYGGSVTAHHWDVALMSTGRCRVTPFAVGVVVPTDLIPLIGGETLTVSQLPRARICPCHRAT